MQATTTTADQIAEHVNSTIRAEAARRGIKLVTLAEHVGFSTVALHRRLSGAVAWNTSELADVAALLGVQVRDLIGPTTP